MFPTKHRFEKYNKMLAKEMWCANPTLFMPKHVRYFIGLRYILRSLEKTW